MLSLGFKRSAVDHGLYVYSGKMLYLVIYVDDIVLFYRREDLDLVGRLTDELVTALNCRKMGEMKDMLGVVLRRQPGSRYCTLDQSMHTEKLLSSAGMTDCKAAASPLPRTARFTKEDCPPEGDETLVSLEDRLWYI